MSLFTDFGPSKSVQYKLGWSMIILMVFMMAINFMLIIPKGLKDVYLVIVKYSRLIKNTESYKKHFPSQELPLNDELAIANKNVEVESIETVEN